MPKDWEEISLEPLTLISDGEEIIGDWAIDRLIERALEAHPQTEVTKLSVAGYVSGTLASLTAPSLFGEPRLVILTHGEKMNKDCAREILDYLNNPEPDVTFALRYAGSATSSADKVLKFLKNHGQHISISKLSRPVDRLNFLRSLIRQQHRRATPGALQSLVDALGSNTRELLSFTLQLLQDHDGTIDESIVHRYWGGRTEVTRFVIADAVAEGNLGRAMALVRHAQATGISPVTIISGIAERLRQISAVRTQGSLYTGVISPGRTSRNKTNTRQSGKKAVATPEQESPEKKSLASLYEPVPFANVEGWQGERAARESRAWSDEGLARAFSALAEADAAVKGASRDREYSLEKAVRIVIQSRGRRSTLN